MTTLQHEFPRSSYYRVEPLRADQSWGVAVHDLSEDSLDDPQFREDLHALFVQAGVILFKGLCTDEACLKISTIFGPLRDHPSKVTMTKEERAFIKIHFTPDDGWLFEVDGEKLGNWQPWHKDLIYVDKINRGGMLKPVVIPSRMGQTGFIDNISAYERLPQRLKDEIEDLHVVYQYDIDVAHQKFGRLRDGRVLRYSEMIAKVLEEGKSFPEVIHPLVYVQPETGRKVLNVSSWFAQRIYERPDAAGDALLEEVVQHAIDERFAYFHDWQQDEMVLWDNWRLLHCAVGCPANEQRTFLRTTIGGDYGLGRIHPHHDDVARQAGYVHV
jgi:taurine dioxygenase